ncbi:MAG TPA: hypothetical protein VN044_01710, partial [Verrucomicrobiae bacterium]|nr:hypothetical protein [Verrucomicrobiae bacterium]
MNRLTRDPSAALRVSANVRSRRLETDTTVQGISPRERAQEGVQPIEQEIIRTAGRVSEPRRIASIPGGE